VHILKKIYGSVPKGVGYTCKAESSSGDAASSNYVQRIMRVAMYSKSMLNTAEKSNECSKLGASQNCTPGNA